MSSPSRAARDRLPRGEAAAVALLTGLALALRCYRLDLEPLWFDEGFAALIVAKPVGEILTLLGVEGNAPLYFAFLHYWILAFGDSEFSLRLPSALAGAAAIPLLFFTGSRIFSRRAGWIAAALAVASPLHVHFSQEARMYSMVALLPIAILYGIHRLVILPRATTALALAAMLTVGFYLHYFFLLLTPLAVFALLGEEPRRSVPLAAGALALATIGFAPWIPTVIGQSESAPVGWITSFWQQYSFAYAVPWSLESLGPGALYPEFSNFKLGSSMTARGISLGLAAFLVGSAALQSYRERFSGPGLAPALVVAAVLSPLLIAFAVSAFRSPIYMVARYDMISWGPYHLLAGAVFARLRTPWMVAGIALWLALSAFTLTPHLTSVRNESVFASKGDAIAERLMRNVRQGETVIFTAGTRTVTDYYLRQSAIPFTRVSFPLGSDDHPGWVDGRIVDDDYAAEEARRIVRQVVDWGVAPKVIWIVAPSSLGTPLLITELEDRGYATDRVRSRPELMRLRISR